MFPIRNTVPRRYPAVVTWTLIAVNCTVFFVELNLNPAALNEFLYRFALIPARFFGSTGDSTPALALSDFVPFVTMMFLHAGWLHLVLNMWMLWLFGAPIEDRLGSIRFFLFYLTCGAIAGATHAMFTPTSFVPALGASGAVAGIMGCHMRLFPMARLIVLVPILFIPLFFQMPAAVFMAIWFALQVFQGAVQLLVPSDAAISGGVAWWAHVGGFVAGFIFAYVLAQSLRRRRRYYDDEGVLGFDRMGRA